MKLQSLHQLQLQEKCAIHISCKNSWDFQSHHLPSKGRWDLRDDLRSKPSPFFSFEILPGTCFHDSNRWRKLDIGWPRVTCIQVWQLWWLPQANEIPSLPPENGTCGSQVLHDSTWLSGCQKDHLNRLTAKRACLSLGLLAVVFGAATGEFWGGPLFSTPV